jgi:hypothetical protein
MTQCSYIYASGLRIEAGDGVVELDGKTLRVLRDGKGESRPDLPQDNPRSDGTITLKDLRTALSERGESSIELTVKSKSASGENLSFSVMLDPDAAMGRKGREGDVEGAFNAMKSYLGEGSSASQRAAGVYQLMTLPDSDKQAGNETHLRLRLAVHYAGGIAAIPHLDGRFGLLADQVLLERTLTQITSGRYRDLQLERARAEDHTKTMQYVFSGASAQTSFKAFEKQQRALAADQPDSLWNPILIEEIGQTAVRVAGAAISDPSRVSDEHFKIIAESLLQHETDRTKRVEFVHNTFDRIDDGLLRETLYRGLKDKRTRAEYTALITNQDRLQRIEDWDPDKNPNMSMLRELHNMTTWDPAHLQARFLGDVARHVGIQFLSPARQEFYRRSTETPLDMVLGPVNAIRDLFKRK